MTINNPRLRYVKFFVLFLTLGLFAYGYIFEPNQLMISHQVIDPDNGGVRLRMAQISDLHIEQIGRREKDVLDHLAREKPDIVLFTGDTIGHADYYSYLETFLAGLPEKTRGYAVMGNWEHYSGLTVNRLRELFSKYGVQLLVNESALMKWKGHDILITGLDDHVAGNPDPVAALRTRISETNHLLMIHAPGYRDILSKKIEAINRDRADNQFRVSLMLSGHTHGGQVRFLGWTMMSYEGSAPYVAGWYRDDGLPDLYVSRGVGNSTIPIRIGAPPELAIFDWRLR